MLDSIPITWGYILLIGISILMIPQHLIEIGKKPSVRLSYKGFFLILPFALTIVTTFSLFGIAVLGLGVSIFLSFSVIPFIFIVLLREEIGRHINSVIRELFIVTIPIVVIYGLLGFLYTFLTGNYFEIPFLTVNGDQVGELMNKHNNRGGLIKLMSTYNNGNIFGICMLLLAPLYFNFETRLIFRLLFRLGLALTLSRTVWIGWTIFELSIGMSGKWTLINAFKLLIVGVLLVTSVLVLAEMMGWDNAVLFDRELGGRSEKFDLVQTVGLFPNKAFNPDSEIVYYQIVLDFGIIGLILFLLAFFGPAITAGFLKPRNPQVNGQWQAAMLAVRLYWVVCLSDGAIFLIPVMAFYWFNVCVLYALNDSQLLRLSAKRG